MDAQIVSHHRPLTTWVLVADGKQAQIYNCIGKLQTKTLGGANQHHLYSEAIGHELIPVVHGTLNAESMDDYELGHDKRGTSSSSNSPTHNTYEPRGDIHAELNRRFMQLIAEKLNRAHADKLFDKLVLVAPSKVIGELNDHLTGALQNDIAAVLSKELTFYKGQELMAHLHETLLQAHVA